MKVEDIIINLPIEGKITREYWDNKEHYLKVVNNNPLEFIHHFYDIFGNEWNELKYSLSALELQADDWKIVE